MPSGPDPSRDLPQKIRHRLRERPLPGEDQLTELRDALYAIPEGSRVPGDWPEAAILLDLALRKPPRRMVQRIDALRARQENGGVTDRFPVFWRDCQAVLDPFTITPHGYNLPLGRRDAASLWTHVRGCIDLLRGEGVEAFLNSGSLLGAVRDGGPVEHDDDVDLGVLIPVPGARDAVDAAARAARGWHDLRERLDAVGLLDPEMETRGRYHARMRSEDLQIDLFPVWVHDGSVFVWPYTYGEVAADDLLPLSELELAGVPLPVPRRPEALLAGNYGAGWREPDPTWRFDWGRARSRFFVFVDEWQNLYAAEHPGRNGGRTTEPKHVVMTFGLQGPDTPFRHGALGGHRSVLDERGWLYPHANPNRVVAVDPATAPEDRAPRRARLVNGLLAEIAAGSGTTVLLTADAFACEAGRESLVELVQRLREQPWFGDAEAVVYLRDRDVRSRELYREQTWLRGNTLPLDEFLAAGGRALDGGELVATLGELFRPRHVRVFEGPDTERSLEHFCDLHGLPTLAPAEDEAVGDADTEAVRRLNAIAPEARGAWPGARVVDPGLTAGALTDERLDGAIRGWLAGNLVQRITVTPYANPDIRTLRVRPSRDRSRLTGVLHWAEDQASDRLVLAAGDLGEVPARHGRRSPLPALRRAGGAGSRNEGFRLDRLPFGAGRTVDLVVLGEDGTRTTIATLRQLWVVPGSDQDPDRVRVLRRRVRRRLGRVRRAVGDRMPTRRRTR